jgi:hypothetical protein
VLTAAVVCSVVMSPLQAMEGVYSQAVGDNILQSIRYEAVARYQVRHVTAGYS